MTRRPVEIDDPQLEKTLRKMDRQFAWLVGLQLAILVLAVFGLFFDP